jgi:hypothetical protein
MTEDQAIMLAALLVVESSAKAGADQPLSSARF